MQLKNLYLKYLKTEDNLSEHNHHFEGFFLIRFLIKILSYQHLKAQFQDHKGLNLKELSQHFQILSYKHSNQVFCLAICFAIILLIDSCRIILIYIRSQKKFAFQHFHFQIRIGLSYCCFQTRVNIGINSITENLQYHNSHDKENTRKSCKEMDEGLKAV